MRAAHDAGVAGVVVALGVGVAVVAAALVGAVVLAAALAALVVAGAAPVVPVSVALPVEHAATWDVRRSASGRTARDGIRLGITRP
jgi:hypothetical protein